MSKIYFKDGVERCPFCHEGIDYCQCDGTEGGGMDEYDDWLSDQEDQMYLGPA